MTACRRTDVETITQEYAVVTCCTPPVDTINPKYANMSKAVLNTVQLTPAASYNMDILPGTENEILVGWKSASI